MGIALALLSLSLWPQTAVSGCTSSTGTCFAFRVEADLIGCYEVVGVSFVNLTGPDSDRYGGALSISTESTVLISESTFLSCTVTLSPNTTWGGAAFLRHMSQATVENCCATACVATDGQFFLLESSVKTGHAFNCSSLVGSGISTPSAAWAFGLYLSGVSAVIERLNSTGCSVSGVWFRFRIG
jgi:hypothetical protein